MISSSKMLTHQFCRLLCELKWSEMQIKILSSWQGHEIDSEEIDETEEDDRIKFRDQLQAIGAFARKVKLMTVNIFIYMCIITVPNCTCRQWLCAHKNISSVLRLYLLCCIILVFFLIEKLINYENNTISREKNSSSSKTAASDHWKTGFGGSASSTL